MVYLSQSSGLSPGAVADAGSGLFAIIWWLLTPLIMVWNIIMGFVFASPPQSSGSENKSQQDGTASLDTAADASVRRRTPGYVIVVLLLQIVSHKPSSLLPLLPPGLWLRAYLPMSSASWCSTVCTTKHPSPRRPLPTCLQCRL